VRSKAVYLMIKSPAFFRRGARWEEAGRSGCTFRCWSAFTRSNAGAEGREHAAEGHPALNRALAGAAALLDGRILVNFSFVLT
jgi:hypothetical protein